MNNKLKKIISVFCFFVFILAGAVATPFTGEQVQREAEYFRDVGLLDQPLIDAIFYFVNGIWYAQYIASILFALFGVVGIVWHAFLLWTSNENIKKALADICIKFVLCSFLMAWYPTIVWGCLDVAHDIGLRICGGEQMLQTAFQGMVMNVTTELEKAKKGYGQLMENLKGMQMDEKMIKELMKASNLGTSDEEIKKWAENHDVKIVERHWYDFLTGAAAAKTQAIKSQKGYSNYRSVRTALDNQCFNALDESNELKNEEITEETIQEKGWKEGVDYIVIVKDGNTKFYKISDNHGKLDKLYGKFRALAKVLGGKVDENFNFENNWSAIERVRDWMYDPFMRSARGTGSGDVYFGGSSSFLPKLLSCSQMIKTGGLIVEIARYADTAVVNPMSGEVETRKTNSLIDFGKIWDLIVLFIMWLCIMAMCIFLAVDYMMVIIEYSVVTTVGFILIPLMLFQHTADYTKKLLGLFIQFMMKVIMQVCVLMFVYCQFLRMGSTYVVGGEGTDGVLGFMNVLFQCVLCYMLCKKAPSLAQTVMSGTPNLNVGDFKNSFDEMKTGGQKLARGATAGIPIAAAGATGVGRIAKSFGKGAINTFQGVKNGVKMGAAEAMQNGKSGMGALGAMLKGGLKGGAIAGGKATLDTVKTSGSSLWDVAKVSKNQGFAALGEALTGVESNNLNMVGRGIGGSGKYGVHTLGDMLLGGKGSPEGNPRTAVGKGLDKVSEVISSTPDKITNSLTKKMSGDKNQSSKVTLNKNQSQVKPQQSNEKNTPSESKSQEKNKNQNSTFNNGKDNKK